jgi:predicted ester cyclase
MSSDFYRAYIACLNRQDWGDLEKFVHRDAVHNDKPLGLAGYRTVLENDFADIPALKFNIEILIADQQYFSCRVAFDCHPKEMFHGLAVNGRRITFAEQVIYKIRDDRIIQV